MLKFPHIFELTFQKLNNQSLFKSMEVARSWKYFINERNYPWLRVLDIPMVLENRNTYLHLAADTAQSDPFKTALSDEEDVNIKNIYGETSFHLACKEGCFKIVELLLENTHLNINAKDNHGYTGFIRASKEGHSELVKILMKNARILSIDLNIQDKCGRTGFYLACLKGHSDVVKIFMENSANLSIDLNAKDNTGRTPFHVACIFDHFSVVKMFMAFD